MSAFFLVTNRSERFLFKSRIVKQDTTIKQCHYDYHYFTKISCRVLLSNIDKSRDKEILEKEIWKVSMACDFIGVALCPYIDIAIIIL